MSNKLDIKLTFDANGDVEFATLNIKGRRFLIAPEKTGDVKIEKLQGGVLEIQHSKYRAIIS